MTVAPPRPPAPPTAPAPAGSAPTPSGPGPLAWPLAAWRALTSMRTALLLLFLLALAAVPGSLLPQRPQAPGAVSQYVDDNPTWGPLADRLGLLDVYASPWFAAVYLALTVSLVGCVVPRTLAHLRSLRAPLPPVPARPERLPAHGTVHLPLAPDDALALVRRRLGRTWRTAGRDGAGPGEVALAAERGRLKELANLGFHLSLIGLLVGLGLGALGGYRGSVLLLEGSGFANSIALYDDLELGRTTGGDDLPPFALTLDDVEADFSGATPTDYVADLTWSPGPGQPDRSTTVRVNEPLRVGGSSVHLQNYGYGVVVRLTDENGDVVADGAVPCLPQDGLLTSTCVVKAPDARPRELALELVLHPTASAGEDGVLRTSAPEAGRPLVVASAFAGDLGLDSGIAQSVYQVDRRQLGNGCLVPLADDAAPPPACPTPPDDVEPRSPQLQVLSPGGEGDVTGTWDLPDGAGRLEVLGLTEWGRFTVVDQPGSQVLLWSSVLVVVAITLTTTVRRRRLFARVVPDGDGSRVVVGALGRADADDVQPDVDRLLERLRATDHGTDGPAGPGTRDTWT